LPAGVYPRAGGDRNDRAADICLSAKLILKWHYLPKRNGESLG
jgi:hypothetical protein